MLHSTQDLAARWDCSAGWLANQRCAGLGPRYIKLGSRVRYHLADVEAYERSKGVATLDTPILDSMRSGALR